MERDYTSTSSTLQSVEAAISSLKSQISAKQREARGLEHFIEISRLLFTKISVYRT